MGEKRPALEAGYPRVTTSVPRPLSAQRWFGSPHRSRFCQDQGHAAARQHARRLARWTRRCHLRSSGGPPGIEAARRAPPPSVTGAGHKRLAGSASRPSSQCWEWPRFFIARTLPCQAGPESVVSSHNLPGWIPKRSNGTDCKSVGPAPSKVRILLHPPPQETPRLPKAKERAATMAAFCVLGADRACNARGRWSGTGKLEA